MPPIAVVFLAERGVERARTEVIDLGVLAADSGGCVTVSEELLDEGGRRSSNSFAKKAAVLPAQEITSMKGSKAQKSGFSRGVAEPFEDFNSFAIRGGDLIHK
jgi:hypothetical protein